MKWHIKTVLSLLRLLNVSIMGEITLDWLLYGKRWHSHEIHFALFAPLQNADTYLPNFKSK